MHIRRVRRTGSVDGATAEVRFFSHLTETLAGCWMWDKPDLKTGYGQFWDNNQKWLPHRWSYEFFCAEIPADLVLDHLCGNRACANPWHLEPVTQRVNLVRSTNFIAVNAAMTHCVRGHPFDEANTSYRQDRPGRVCRACSAIRSSSYQSRRLVGNGLRG